MLKEQSKEFPNWFFFNDRNAINEIIAGGKYPNEPHRKFADQLKMPADYCNLPLAKFYEDENALGKDWQLKKVFLFIRHGQRSSSDPMTNANYEYHINCSLKQFPLFKKHDWKRFIDTVKKSSSHFTKFETYERCSENQMTLFGILQMFIMGTELQKSYTKFLDSNSVRIFSTLYQRSILSGEIIQHLLVKDSINSRRSEIEEAQSLIFCRPTSDVPCHCPSLRYYYAKYNRHLNSIANTDFKCINLVNYFNSILVRNGSNDQSHLLSLSSLFDIISSALCASNLEEISKANSFCWPLKGDTIDQDQWGFLNQNADVDEKDPTNGNGSHNLNMKSTSRCFSLHFITNLWQCFDNRNAAINNYPDFRRYAKLAAYPILKEIISKVKDTKVRRSEKQYKSNFSLYIGHDHSLRFILGALNFKDNINQDVKEALNTWPGFASRIALEVFKNANKSSIGSSEQRFRLLYNGLDITSSLTICESTLNGCSIHLLDQHLNGVGFWDKELFATSSYSTECKLA